MDVWDRAALRSVAITAARTALLGAGVGAGAIAGSLVLGLAVRVFGAASGLW